MSIDPIRTAFGLSSTVGLQRNFQTSQAYLDQTLNRLSTGLRLNSAADDPTNFIRARQFETRAISTLQAQENSQEGSLLFKTAEDGAKSILSNLNRLRTLALLSMTDTTSDADREGIQTEIGLLVSSIRRMADTTSYNTRNLLDGSYAGPRAASDATATILENKTIRNDSGGLESFITGVLSVDPSIAQDSVIEFNLFESSPGVLGLEVVSSNLGVLATYNDVSTLGNTLDLDVDALGSAQVQISVPTLDTGGSTPVTGTSGPLTNAELNTSIATLVADGRINAVTYGALNLTLGATLNSSIIDVQGTSTLQDVLDAINATGATASYNTTTGLFSVSFTGQEDASNTTVINYDPSGAPVSAPGSYTDYGLIPDATDGPGGGAQPYPDITGFLPSGPFDPDSLPGGTFFLDPSDIAVDTGADFTTSTQAVLDFFGLSTTYANNPTITAYTDQFYGEVIDMGGGDYVNRTRVVVTDITGEQDADGTTDLSGIDTSRSLDDLTAPTVYNFDPTNKDSLLNGMAGDFDFTIDFGTNGTFDSSLHLVNSVDGSIGFDPDKTTLQDIVDAINQYGIDQGFSATPGATDDQVLATINPATGLITINNNVPSDPYAGMGIIQDTDIPNSSITVDFGSGVSAFINTPKTATIQSIVDDINNSTGYAIASFDFDSKDDVIQLDLSVLGAAGFVDGSGNRYFQAALTGASGKDADLNPTDLFQVFKLPGVSSVLGNKDAIVDGVNAQYVDISGGPAADVVRIYDLSGTGVVTSSQDIDLGFDQPNDATPGGVEDGTEDPRELTTNAGLFTTLEDLVIDVGSTSVANNITFGGTNGAAVADLFNVSTDLGDDTDTNTTSVVSAPSINTNPYDGTVAVDANATIRELLETSADLPTAADLIGGRIVLGGVAVDVGGSGADSTIITADLSIDDIISAISAHTGSDNRSYSAAIDGTSGALVVTVSDTENTTAPGASAGADPGGASPTVTGNELTLDSAQYTASGGVTPQDFGQAPGGPLSSAPDPGVVGPYSFNDAAAPTDISNIVFGGATNIFTVLGLSNAPDASVSGPTNVAEEYSGTATDMGDGTYDLAGTKVITYEATSNTTSGASVGNDTTSGGGGGSGIPAENLGTAARIYIKPFEVGNSDDRGLIFQISPEQGHTLKGDLKDLTSTFLRLEGLNVIGDSDLQTYLLGVETLAIVDDAIGTVRSAIGTFGAFQNVLNRTSDYLADQQIDLNAGLSTIQDANLEEELANLDRAKLVNTTSAAALSEARTQKERIFGILFGGSGIGGGGFV